VIEGGWDVSRVKERVGIADERKETQLDIDVVTVKRGDKAHQIIPQLDVNVRDL